MHLNINATRAFILCFFTILNQKEFRIATVAMFTCDLYAGVVVRTTSNGYARLWSSL